MKVCPFWFDLIWWSLFELEHMYTTRARPKKHIRSALIHHHKLFSGSNVKHVFPQLESESGWVPSMHMQSNWTCSFGHVSVAREVECLTPSPGRWCSTVAITRSRVWIKPQGLGFESKGSTCFHLNREIIHGGVYRNFHQNKCLPTSWKG